MTIKLISACRREEFNVGEFHYSARVPLESAEALLCEWGPSEELLTYPGPKAWYCCEATSHLQFRNPQWQRVRAALRPSEFLYHAHPDPRFRVPHTDIEGYREVELGGERLDRAITMISNVSSPRWFRRRGGFLAMRQKFATHPSVDLYGRHDAWLAYHRHPWSAPALPSNYCGEVEGYWNDESKFQLMKKYKAAVCMENTLEPFYFTEKFLGAVQSGCIPIYAAHPSVKASFLQGAKWVDPADFRFSVEKTLEFALARNRSDYTEANKEWFFAKAIHETSNLAVFARIGDILKSQKNSRTDDATMQPHGNFKP